MIESITLPDVTKCQGCAVATEAIEAAREALQKRIERDRFKPETTTISVSCELNLHLKKVAVTSDYSGSSENRTFGGITHFNCETKECRNFRLLLTP